MKTPGQKDGSPVSLDPPQLPLEVQKVITKCKNCSHIIINKRKASVNSEKIKWFIKSICKQNKINNDIQDQQIYFIFERFVTI